MPNAKMITVRDFNGGLNDLVPPDQVANNESIELVNLIPGGDGQPLQVRPGSARLNDTPFADKPIKGLFRYRMKSGARYWVTTCGPDVKSTAVQSGSKPILYDNTKVTYSHTDATALGIEADKAKFAFGSWRTAFDTSVAGSENIILPRSPVTGTSAQLRYSLQTPESTHQVVFGFRNQSAGEMMFIKVGQLSSGVALKQTGEFWLEISGTNRHARVAYRSPNGAIHYTPAVTLTEAVKNTLEWTLTGKLLRVKINGTPFAGLNFGNFGKPIVHNSVLFQYKGTQDGVVPATDAMLQVYSITDEVQNFKKYGTNPPYMTSTTPGSIATLTYTSTLDNERVEIWARKATKVTIQLDGVNVKDEDGVDVVLSNTTNVSKALAQVDLGTKGAHTIKLVVSVPGTPGELVFDKFSLLPPNQPFADLVSGRTTDFSDTDFCVLSDKLLFVDGASEPDGKGLMYVWNGTGTVSKQTTSVAKHPAPGVDETTDMPVLRYLQTFRGRAWAAGDPNHPSRVHYSAPLDPTNWFGTGTADGNNLDIDPDNGEIVTGIGRLFNGVVVFKERSIYLWTFGDADNPAMDGRVEQLVPGTGCVSHYSIAYYNGAMIFLGQNGEGDYGVFRLTGSGVEEYSLKIPKQLKRILSTGNRPPKGVAHDHHYFVSVVSPDDPDGTRSLTFVLDLRRMCWTTVEGIEVGSWAIDRQDGDLYFGSDDTGLIYQYGTGHTDDGQPIRYSYRSKPLDGNEPLAGHRFRNLWLDLNGSSSGDVTVGYSLDGGSDQTKPYSLRIPGLLYWDDPGITWFEDGDPNAIKWWDGEIEKHISIPIPTNRAKHMAVVIKGQTASELAIARYGVAFRERKTRY